MLESPARLREAAADALIRGEIEQALACYRQLERKIPDQAVWSLRAADCYHRLGRREGEISALARALARFDSQGFARETGAVCRRVLALDPHHPGALAAQKKLQECGQVGLARMRSLLPASLSAETPSNGSRPAAGAGSVALRESRTLPPPSGPSTASVRSVPPSAVSDPALARARELPTLPPFPAPPLCSGAGGSGVAGQESSDAEEMEELLELWAVAEGGTAAHPLLTDPGASGAWPTAAARLREDPPRQPSPSTPLFFRRPAAVAFETGEPIKPSPILSVGELGRESQVDAVEFCEAEVHPQAPTSAGTPGAPRP